MVKDAGQGVARLLRTQPGCDKPGAEQVKIQSKLHSGSWEQGSLKQKTHTSMGFLWDSQAICEVPTCGETPEVKAEGCQAENPEGLVCVLQKPMLAAQRHPACS